jgi:sigma-E factor negative regulatory protein RseC
LGNYLGKRMDNIMVMNPIGAKAGDKVVVGLEEGALVLGSLAIYLVPLVLMMLGAFVGQMAATNLGFVASDGVTAIAGLFGLGLGFVWMKFFSSKIATGSRYQPVILRFDNEVVKCNIQEENAAKEAV